MNKVALLCLVMIISSASLFAQHNHKHEHTIRCHTDERIEALKDTDPEYYRSLQQAIVLLPETSRSVADIITIPVHVIIVHPPGQAVGTGVNFPMDHIQSQIDVLNEDFRRLNSDADNTPDVFAAGDSEIEFCLAIIDPDGNDTDGVTRYGTNQNLNANEFAIKSATGWDRNNYLNMWVGPGLGGILGWAYLPSTTNLPNPTLDGVVIASGTFGGPGYGTAAPYDLGRTATHEVGHYLGLNHVWRNNGCGADDGFADTPLQDDSNFGCPNHPSPSCGNAGDMFMNYMDYVNDNCMNAFSVEQGAYMRQILNTSRSSLLDAADTYCSVSGQPLTVIVVDQTDVLCFGGDTGSLTVAANGGDGDYTYSIDGVIFQSSELFFNLTAGDYTVTVQDGTGATATVEVTIAEGPELFLAIEEQIDVRCFGDNNGTLIVNATGGTPNPGNIYDYSIDSEPYAPVNVFTDLTAGPHIIMVRDANGCEAQLDAFLVEPQELVTLPEEITDATCFGAADGLISVVTVGGNPLYIYTIDQANYQLSPIFFDLAPGDYLLTTVDENACFDEMTFTINQPDSLGLAISSQTDVSCFGETDASITLEASGGILDYQYTIDGTVYQAGATFDNLAPGTYSASVLDNNNCFAGIEVVLEAPEELVLTLVEQTDAGCAGQSEGSLTVTAIGGAGDNSFEYGTETQTGDTVTFSNLPAGIHDITVFDANNCSSELSIPVEENGSITFDTLDLQNISCFMATDGVIEVVGNGGSGTYQYSINGSDYSAQNLFTGLSSGDYTINILDESGCEGTTLIALVAPDVIITEIESQTNPACFGDANGSLDVLATGGAGGFNYTLNAETNATGVFNDLAPASYEVIATDANGCTQMIAVDIEAPTEINLEEILNEPASCFEVNDAKVSLTANGGTSGFEYTINGVSNTTGVFENLAAGTYLASVTDANDCVQTLEVVLTEPEVLEATIDYVSDVSCAGDASGAIQIETNGGSGTITYTLGTTSNNSGLFEGLVEGDYTIEVQDGNACATSIDAAVAASDELEIAEDELTPVSCFGAEDGAIQLLVSGGNGGFEYSLDTETNTSGLFENLAPGTYSALVTDGSACSGTYDFEILEPTALTAAIELETDISCFGETDGMIQLTAEGGTGTYIFDNGTTSNSTGLFENLTAGDYEITVTDVSLCNTAVIATIEAATALQLGIINQEDVGCNGDGNGSFTVLATGGSGPFEYTANGETNTTGVFENLAAGMYPVSVLDANACNTALEVLIEETDAIELEVTNTVMNNCFGSDEGSIQVAANGGTGDLQYTLGTETNATGLFENLPAGDYEIQAQDANGCTNRIAQVITEPAVLSAEVSLLESNDCFGLAEGMVQLVATGGTGNLTYTLGIQNNDSGLFENLAAGDYDILITDENNCSINQAVTITEPTALTSEIIDLQNIECNGSGTGAIQVQANGGNGTYEYTLGTETNTTGLFENLPAGAYEIAVLDLNACTTMQAFNIVESANLTIEVDELESIECFGAATGSIQVMADGGSGTYDFALGGTVNTTGLFENLTGGAYEIAVTDQDGCTDILRYDLLEPTAISYSITDQQQPDCASASNGSLQLSAEGGDGVFQYTFNGETNTTGSFSNLNAGIYELEIVDGTSCSILSMLEVEAPEPIAIMTIENNPVACFGGADGSLQVQGAGGTGTYAYTLGMESNATGSFSNLPAGMYEVVLRDENACVETVMIEVEQTPEIITEVITIENIECNSSELGSITVQATGGSGTFAYTLNGQTNTTGSFENLPAGLYEIHVEDANTCSTLQAFSITEGADLNVEVEVLNEITCFGNENASLQINADGGTGDLAFSLNGETNTTGFFENLAGGTYDLVVTDTDGCESSIQYLINQPAEVVLEMVEPNMVSCYGGADGAVSILVSGGGNDFTYNLNNETNTSGEFYNLAAGDYPLIAVDGNGCSINSMITIEEMPALNIEVEQNVAISCYGADDGMLELNGVGGTGTYLYTLGFETNATGVFENLSGGMYSVLMTDENNCTDVLELTVEQPAELAIELTNLQAIGCGGNVFGAAQVLASGGTGPLEYTLGAETNTTGVFDNLNLGAYVVEVRDEKGCTDLLEFSIVQNDDLEAAVLSNSAANCFGAADGSIQLGVTSGNGTYEYTLGTETNTSGIFTGLNAGDYLAEVNDGGGCNTSVSFTITEPAAMIVESFEVNPLTCFGENSAVIQLEAFGGAAPYTYILNNEFNSSGGFENLAAGTYEAVVSDQNGCTVTEEIIIIAPDAILPEVVASVDPVCYGGTSGVIQLNAEGGTFPYTYTVNGVSNETGVFEDLGAGNYMLMVTDDQGCTNTESITLSQPPVLISGVLDITPVGCSGGEDAVVFMGAQGGTPGYTFELEGETNGGGVFFNLGAGEYPVIVTDANACTSETVVIVNEPAELILEASDVLDDTGSGNGRVSLSPQGGVGPFEFAFNGGSFSLASTFDNLTVGTYTAICRDANGCLAELTFTIEMGTFITNPEQGVNDFQLFPNPFSESLNLTLDLTNAQALELRMFTIHGQEIYFYKKHYGVGTTNERLDLPANLPAGAYLFSIKNEQTHLGYYKLIKQ